MSLFWTVTDLNLVTTSLCMWYQGHISLRLSRNSEAKNFRILENLEEMFLCHSLQLVDHKTNEFMDFHLFVTYRFF